MEDPAIQASFSYSTDAFWFSPMSLGKRLPFQGSSCNIVHAVTLTKMSLMLYHSCTAGHPSVGGGQLLPGPTLALGLFFRLFMAPYS
jgi:hypothetical protein